MPAINYIVRTTQAQAALSALEAKMMMTSGVIASGARVADKALMAVSASFIAMGAGAFVAYNAVAQFQESLTTVRALGGVTETQMYELADSINEVSAQFGVSGDEIAAGAVMLSKAGLTVEEINQSIGSMTALSKANGLAFEEAARMTVFAVNTFGKEFSEATDLMDAMQVATQESILDIGDLQKAFAFAGSTAVMSGVSFEQLISIMAVLSNRALEAGISARSVNKMFLDMIMNTDELQEFMNGLGMTFEIIRDGKLDIDALMAAFSGEQLTLEMLQSASDVFTVRALRSFGLLLGAADDYQTMLADVTNSQGALAEVVAVQMQSFTAMFAKLRQEFLAPLRSPEVIEQVGIFVDGFIEMFKALQPQLLSAIIMSLESFGSIISSEEFQNAMERLGTGLFRVFQMLDFIMDMVGGPAGPIMKLAVSLKVASFFTAGYAAQQQVLAQSMQAVTAQMAQHKLAFQTAYIGPKSFIEHANFQTQRLTMQMQLQAQTISMVTASIMGMLSIGMLVGSTDDPLLMGVFVLMAAFQAFNSTLMISQALLASFQYSLSGPQMIAIGAGLMATMALTAMAFHKHRQEQMKDIQSGYQVADTGYFAPGTKKYDQGGIAPRHQLVYVEPGEQIISKTQGMVGMGAGLTVNVGDVYAQDGTDFAQKLADELPKALRMSSYRGAF